MTSLVMISSLLFNYFLKYYYCSFKSVTVLDIAIIEKLWVVNLIETKIRKWCQIDEWYKKINMCHMIYDQTQQTTLIMILKILPTEEDKYF